MFQFAPQKCKIGAILRPTTMMKGPFCIQLKLSSLSLSLSVLNKISALVLLPTPQLLGSYIFSLGNKTLVNGRQETFEIYITRTPEHKQRE